MCIRDSLYLHVPFCARRCTYCDFAIAVRRVVPVDEYLGALQQELTLRYPPTTTPWELDTLYLGGGTPSRLGGEGVARVVELVRSRAVLAPGAEVTVEANPEDVLPGVVARWREAGVNRVSLGAQTFDPAALDWMHRVHAADRIGDAVATMRAEGIRDFSLDLIFALPAQLSRAWEADVRQALALEPTHLSLYGLTVEPHTPLGRQQARGEVTEAPEERYEAEFLRANALLTGAGFEHYEVSNFARPGHRARHNSSYWRGVEYAGVGPSAHEYDGRARRWNVAPYVDWVGRLAAGRDPMDGSETLSPENRVAETVYLGLRTTEGLRLTPGEHAVVAPWVAAGWGVIDQDVLRLSPLGWLRLDALAAALTSYRSC